MDILKELGGIWQNGKHLNPVVPEPKKILNSPTRDFLGGRTTAQN